MWFTHIYSVLGTLKKSLFTEQKHKAVQMIKNLTVEKGSGSSSSSWGGGGYFHTVHLIFRIDYR